MVLNSGHKVIAVSKPSQKVPFLLAHSVSKLILTHTVKTFAGPTTTPTLRFGPTGPVETSTSTSQHL